MKSTEGEPLFELNDGRIQLTPRGMGAGYAAFKKAAQAAGIGGIPSKSTFYRAKGGDGVMVLGFHEAGRGNQRRLPYGFVRLLDAERELDASSLARRHGITLTTAGKALARGWYEVRSTQRLTDLAQRRIEGIDEYLPEDLQS